MPHEVEFRTLEVGPTKTAEVEVRNLSSNLRFRADVRMEWGFGVPSKLVVEIRDEQDERFGNLYLPRDSAGRFPTY